MSFTPIRGARAALLSALALTIVVATGVPQAGAAGSVRDRAVRSSPLDERTPVEGSGYLAWAESRPGHPQQYSVWIRALGHHAMRITPETGVAYAGGIDGDTLVYQQSVGHGSSGIRFYDFVTGTSRPAPGPVNSAAEEFGPSLSGRWLLFTREFSEPTVWKVLLYDLQTGRMRTLDRVSGPFAHLAQSGQVAGDYATWQVCTPYCKVFEYRISTRQTWFVPDPDRHFQYAPSVTADGSVWFAESHAACGGVSIRRYRPGGQPVTVAGLRANTDLSFTSARTLQGGRVDLLYDATSCTDFSGNLRALTIPN
jgi:hypothetical protein